MRATHLIQRQLDTVRGLYHDVGGDLTDAEWTTRRFPHTNMAGFTLWHMARSQDLFVHTFIRGVPEVIRSQPWATSEMLLRSGIGMTEHEADSVAHLTSRADILNYADAVYQSIARWLDTLADADLDMIPDAESHVQPFADYNRPAFREETSHLFGVPAWRLLNGPCHGHIRTHIGEIELLKQLLRDPATT